MGNEDVVGDCIPDPHSIVLCNDPDCFGSSSNPVMRITIFDSTLDHTQGIHQGLEKRRTFSKRKYAENRRNGQISISERALEKMQRQWGGCKWILNYEESQSGSFLFPFDKKILFP